MNSVAVIPCDCEHYDLVFPAFAVLMCALGLQWRTCVWSQITAVSTSVRARLVPTTVSACPDTRSTRTARPAHVCTLTNYTSQKYDIIIIPLVLNRCVFASCSHWSMCWREAWLWADLYRFTWVFHVRLWHGIHTQRRQENLHKLVMHVLDDVAFPTCCVDEQFEKKLLQIILSA